MRWLPLIIEHFLLHWILQHGDKMGGKLLVFESELMQPFKLDEGNSVTDKALSEESLSAGKNLNFYCLEEVDFMCLDEMLTADPELLLVATG